MRDTNRERGIVKEILSQRERVKEREMIKTDTLRVRKTVRKTDN
jgi:hypothetical protein